MFDTDAQPIRERMLELDALRGIAAVAVLVCHLPRGFWFGETGVDLFFVLSGFLITGIILRSMDQPGFLRTFYVRRSLRIFPIYYLVLFAAYGVNLIRTTPGDTAGFPFYLVYLQNVQEYWGGDTPHTDMSLNHTWTLAIEEQFYLFWPVVFVLFKKRAALWLAVVLIGLPVALRHMGISKLVLFAHTDGLAMGALLAWLMLQTASVRREKKACGYAGIAIIAFITYGALYWKSSFDNPAFTPKGFLAMNAAISVISVAYFGLIGFVVCMSGSPWLAVLRNRILVSVGTISYGLYLYHWLLYEHLDTVVKFGWRMGDPWWLDVIKLFTSFAVAIGSWHIIEQPILRLKDRFDYSRERAIANRPAVLMPAGIATAHE